MKFEEINRNLFKVGDDYCLAHCISSDLEMSQGIATHFQAFFEIREEILSARVDTEYPTCLFTNNRVFNLITKNRYYQKPTYAAIRMTLEYMRDMCIELEITKIAMPKIGCGKDKMKWQSVRKIIREVFQDTDIEILVCYI